MESLVLRHTKALFSESDETEEHTIQEEILSALGSDSAWIDMYEVTGEIHVPGFHSQSSIDLVNKLKNVSENSI